MKISIKYENEFGVPIDDVELQLLNSYTKVFESDGKHKKSEVYRDNKLTIVDYTLYNNENIDDILLEYPLVRINFMLSIETYNNYKQETYVSYKSGIIIGKGEAIVTVNGYLICSRRLCIENDQPILESTSKYFHFNDEEHYEFYYNSNGSLLGMYSIYSENSGDWRASELNDLGSFSWSQVGNYYLTAEPIIPDVADL